MSAWGIDGFEFGPARDVEYEHVATPEQLRGWSSGFEPPVVQPALEPCESCGTPVFQLQVSGAFPEDRRYWMERPRLTGNREMTMTSHTPQRCRAARESLS